MPTGPGGEGSEPQAAGPARHTVSWGAPPAALCSLIKAQALRCFSRLADEGNLSHPCTKAQRCTHPSPDARTVRHSRRALPSVAQLQPVHRTAEKTAAECVSQPLKALPVPPGLLTAWNGRLTLPRKPQGHP